MFAKDVPVNDKPGQDPLASAHQASILGAASLVSYNIVSLLLKLSFTLTLSHSP